MRLAAAAGFTGGAIGRWLLLAWTCAMFSNFPPVLGPCVIGIIYIPVVGLHKRIYAFYKFLYGPTPSQLIRSYNKLWPVVKNGPIQKTIKVSPPTP
jgi:hypothetical protein